MRVSLLIFTLMASAGCALSQQGGGDIKVPDGDALGFEVTPPEAETNGTPAEKPEEATAEKPEAAAAKPAEETPQGNGESTNGQAAPQLTPPPTPTPWAIFTRVRNGYGTNVDFDESEVGSYGAVLANVLQFNGDDFEFNYEIAGHSYTNTNRWDRVSHALEASYELPWFSGKWDMELEGTLGFKGSSEDRDIVDQDVEFSPKLEYSFTPERRLVLYTKHRLKRYDDAPDTNAFKNYAGIEFREFFGRRYVELGARYETNDERINRSDSIRYSYWVSHAIPVTARDTIGISVRYRLKRYLHRFVEVEDEDVLRADHRWTPTIAWTRLVGKVDLSFEYGYEKAYSNDFEKEYKAHMAWTSIGYRWK